MRFVVAMSVSMVLGLGCTSPLTEEPTKFASPLKHEETSNSVVEPTLGPPCDA